MLHTEIPTLSSTSISTLDQNLALKDYMSMVSFQANQIYRRLPLRVDLEELYSVGLVGLWEAYVKFDPAKNVKFLTYAQFRVRGAILDSLRASDWAPRALRSKERAAQKAIRTLSSRLGRTPTEDEIAAELRLSTLEYQQLLSDLHGLEIGTLHRPFSDDLNDEELVHVPDRPENDPFFLCMKGEVRKHLTRAIEALPDQQRLVITLYYYEELTHSEISLVLEKSESRVHQIRTSAVRRLRAALSDLNMEQAPSSPVSLKLNPRKSSSSTERGVQARHVETEVPRAEHRLTMGTNLEPCIRPAQAFWALGAMRTVETSLMQ